jgi:phospholipase C
MNTSKTRRSLAVCWAIAAGIGISGCSSSNGSSPSGDDAGPTTDGPAVDGAAKLAKIGTVFIVIFENHNFSQIIGNTTAPYINSLLGKGAYAKEYYNPPMNHPSLPNYLWIHAGDNLGIIDDNEPEFHSLSTTDHLADYLEKANITWKAYEESIDGTTCPMSETPLTAPKHEPFVYFSDVTNNVDPMAPRCLAHIRPFSELATDIANNKVARYNFITPNLCNDMHDCGVGTGDTWLSTNLPVIMASSQYTNNGAIFVTWDEADDGDGPIGMIALSPKAKAGYSNTIHYDHSSMLKTLQEIFGVMPLLRHAADPTTNDLSDLFSDAE